MNREIAVAAIDIDFDVYKALTIRRASEATSYNDVLRELLGLPPQVREDSPAPSGGCLLQGVLFPEGTQFRVVYKGVVHGARIQGGQWVGDDGKVRRSPSDAARAITNNNVNGWRFWTFRRPGEGSFRKMSVLQDVQ